jgi:hypothetical protein
MSPAERFLGDVRLNGAASPVRLIVPSLGFERLLAGCQQRNTLALLLFGRRLLPQPLARDERFGISPALDDRILEPRLVEVRVVQHEHLQLSTAGVDRITDLRELR